MKHTKKALSIVFACISAICLVAAGVLVFIQWRDDIRSHEALEALRLTDDTMQTAPDGSGPMPDASEEDDASGTGDATGTNASSESEAASESDPMPAVTPEYAPAATPEPTPAPVENPYRNSFLANSDMAAWLQIPGTDIDYPVMWTPEDEEYYLYRGFDGSNNRNGCLILDTDSCLDPLTTNLIIHGHNQESGAMFGHLPEYEDFSFYEEHKNIILYTKELQRNYEIIAVFRSQVYKKTDQVFKYYKFFQADTQEEFDDFYQNIKDMSLYDTGVSAEFGDHFLTLSTCVYHVERGRLVVVAKEAESGDSYLPVGE